MARAVQVHCVGAGLEAKTLKLTVPAAWAASPCARLLKAVAKKCGVDPAKGADDGVFWICFSDFLRYFDAVDVLKRSEDLHDVYLDTHEDMPVCGPCRGCVVGCCCYFCACKGATKLCCGRATDDATVRVEKRRDCCC